MTNLYDDPEMSDISKETHLNSDNTTETHLTGAAYVTTSKLISEMNDAELETHILSFKRLVYETQEKLDYRRTQLTIATNESEERITRKRRAMRNMRIPGQAQAQKHNPAQHVVSRAGISALEKLRASGLSASQIRDLLQVTIQLKNDSNREVQ